jgi:hypothetical protein
MHAQAPQAPSQIIDFAASAPADRTVYFSSTVQYAVSRNCFQLE